MTEVGEYARVDALTRKHLKERFPSWYDYGKAACLSSSCSICIYIMFMLFPLLITVSMPEFNPENAPIFVALESGKFDFFGELIEGTNLTDKDLKIYNKLKDITTVFQIEEDGDVLDKVWDRNLDWVRESGKDTDQQISFGQFYFVNNTLNNEFEEEGRDDWQANIYMLVKDFDNVVANSPALPSRPEYFPFVFGINDDMLQVVNKFKILMAKLTDTMENAQVGFMNYDTVAYKKIIISWFLVFFVGFFVMRNISLDFFHIQKFIIEERQLGTRDLMSFLGLTQTTYWISQIIASILQLFPSTLLNSLILLDIIRQVGSKNSYDIDLTTYILFIFSFVMTIINMTLFTCATSSFIVNDSIHYAFWLIIAWLMCMLVPFVLLLELNNEATFIRIALQIFPICNFQFTLRDVLRNESKLDNVAFYFVNLVVWTLLTIYLDQVVPKLKGTSKSCCYCLQSGGENNLNDDGSIRETKVLQIQNVIKRYGSLTAVDDVSLELDGNQIYGLLGFNGAGKTTLLNMITGLDTTTEGNIRVFGKNIATNIDSLRRIMGICPQFNISWPLLSVIDHLLLFGRLRGIDDNTIMDHATIMMDQLSLTHVQHSLSKDLSGGEKRKMMIIQAFLGNPRFLLLDEPTAGVDIDSRRQIHNLILSNRQDKLIMLTTHHMEEADTLANNIGIMSKGKIILEGTPTYLKVTYGIGHTFRIPSGNRDLFTNSTFNVQFNQDNDHDMMVLQKKEDIIPALKILEENVASSDISIKADSLETVFLQLGGKKRRDEQTTPLTFQNCARPNMVSMALHLMYKRLKLFMKNPAPLLESISVVAVFALLTIFFQHMIGVKGNLTDLPSFADVPVGCYGDENDLLNAVCDSFKSISAVKTIYDDETIRIVSNGGVKFEASVSYVIDMFPIINKIFTNQDALEWAKSVSIDFLSQFNYFLQSWLFTIASATAMTSITFWTLNEMKSGMFDSQILTGVPPALLWGTNLCFDYLLSFAIIIAFSAIVSSHDMDQFSYAIISAACTFGSFLLVIYIFAKVFSIDSAVTSFSTYTIGSIFVMNIIPSFEPDFWNKLMVLDSDSIDWSQGMSQLIIGIIGFFFYINPPMLFFICQLIQMYSKDEEGNLTFGHWPNSTSLNTSVYVRHYLICIAVNIFWLLGLIAVELYAFYKEDPQELSLIPSHDEQNTIAEYAHDEIVADGISKTFINHEFGYPVVANNKVSYKFKSGRCYGLLGRNGAGKSTQMKIFSTLVRPTYGNAYVYGINIAENPQEVRNMIGVCEQQNSFWETFTAKEHLEYFAVLKGVPPNEIEMVINTLAQRLEFEEHLNTYCGNLSGGNKRKVLFATSIIGKVEFLLLDEPSAGVDPFAREQIRQVLKEFKEDRSILFTSHIMEEAELMCDEIAIMDHAKVELQGSINDLISTYSKGFFLEIDVSTMIGNDAEFHRMYAYLGNVIPSAQNRDAPGNVLYYHIENVDKLYKLYEVAETLDKDFGCKCMVQSQGLNHLFLKVSEVVDQQVEGFQAKRKHQAMVENTTALESENEKLKEENKRLEEINQKLQLENEELKAKLQKGL